MRPSQAAASFAPGSAARTAAARRRAFGSGTCARRRDRATTGPSPPRASREPWSPPPLELRRPAPALARRRTPRSPPEASGWRRPGSPELLVLRVRDGARELIFRHRRATAHVQLLRALEQLVLRRLLVPDDDVLAMLLGFLFPLTTVVLLDDLPVPGLHDDLFSRLGSRQAGHLLEALEPRAEILVLLLQLVSPAAQRGVGFPPIDAHLLRALNRGHQEPQLDREQLDVEQVDLDVSRDHDALVEHPFEYVRQVRRAAGPLHLHPARIH